MPQNSNRDGFGYETYKTNGVPTGRPGAKTTSGTKKVVKKVRLGFSAARSLVQGVLAQVRGLRGWAAQRFYLGP